MSNPLTDEAVSHIEKSWAMVQEFGLQEAGIVMFKRSVLPVYTVMKTMLVIHPVSTDVLLYFPHVLVL